MGKKREKKGKKREKKGKKRGKEGKGRVGGIRNEDVVERRELEEKVGGMIVRHFGGNVQRRVGKIGVIGIDIGKERFWMKKREEDRKRENELRLQQRLDEIGRKEVEQERRMKEIEKNAKLERNRMQNEEDALRKIMKEDEETRKRQSRKSYEVVDWYDRSNTQYSYDCSGSRFSLKSGANLVLLSHVSVSGCFRFGVTSVAQTGQLQNHANFPYLPQTAGWCCDCRKCIQNSKVTQSGTACEKGVNGQRVVLEADGRGGRRTLRLSQNGLTQPTFFSNIPVPFRFVVSFHTTQNYVYIESATVVKAPLMTNGLIVVRMD
ncbi:hypothetical protein BLNAU_9784 [Blattamonas nauphoetae]|uniref:Uncharacterized protein n=1 Tax=Blattamonas nauphoetae TaxID=2049346 RepID=A0ABQ9XUS0_9EUKA|nr:hypothetical protein BLNAU_9784 [Blattamonas nauphoetae]